MAVIPIRIFGDPVLRTECDDVTEFDDALRALVDDMVDTMIAYQGAGLAAPQIGVTKRIFVYRVDGEIGHIINPVIEWTSEQTQTDPEGCLSIPGLKYDTTRALQARATGQDVEGNPITLEGEGLLARAIQHETDHLHGILFFDRLTPELRRQALRDARTAPWARASTAPRPKVSNSPFGI